MKVIPQNGYMLVEKIERETGVATGSDVEDTHQLWKVLAVSDGYWKGSQFIENDAVEPGVVVYTMKHAEADTPKELKDRDQAVIHLNRVIAEVQDNG